MSCDDVRAALASFSSCEVTPSGARVATHCLYPSHEPVYVYVVKHGTEGYIIHDAGEAARIADLHGRDEKLQDRALRSSAKRFDVDLVNGQLRLSIESKDWLRSAIVTVANSAAHAAYKAIELEVRNSEIEIADIVFEQLIKVATRSRVSKDVELIGRSGRHYEFDFAVSLGRDNLLPVDVVSAHPNSIASKFVAFSDTYALSEKRGLAAHHGSLKQADLNLLSDVATLVPANAIEPNLRRIMLH
ncbi:hypothetical protein [Oceanicaulis alexandrii]|uniref:hypothetical protein n=1 Tax=Oceanicaulis alexandrii TaxID=153233 RepID=UPI003B50EC53|tara:strand:- start:95 stop:829 length:735 start_codon:yes stop_codon:yes gene_type:complete